MNKVADFLKQNLWKVTTVVFLIAFLSKGCTNNQLNKINRSQEDRLTALELKIDSLGKRVDLNATSKQVRDEMEITMFNFLIYEDDLDKGKVSLSGIKDKIESND